MTIRYRGTAGVNRWVFVDADFMPERVIFLDFNPTTRSFHAHETIRDTTETAGDVRINGEPIDPHLRALLPTDVLASLTRQMLRRRR